MDERNHKIKKEEIRWKEIVVKKKRRNTMERFNNVKKQLKKKKDSLIEKEMDTCVQEHKKEIQDFSSFLELYRKFTKVNIYF